MHNMRFERPNKSFSVPFKKYKWENAMRFFNVNFDSCFLNFYFKNNSKSKFLKLFFNLKRKYSMLYRVSESMLMKTKINI
jgi:hypothetical protein